MKTYYKLVRDNIPELIKKDGKKAIIKKIEKSDFKYYLKIKLKEEVDEILKTESKIELTQRIADVVEVINYLTKEYNINQSDINKAQKDKLHKKGKYNKRTLLIVTEDYE